MIRSFSVKNFKSIRDEVTLHFDAYQEDRIQWGNVSETLEGPILNVVGLWGPNASGKSNVWEALAAFRSLVASSHRNELDKKIAAFEPFKLTEESKESSISFSLEFFERRTHELYSYSVIFDRKDILLEKLVRLNGEREDVVYERDQLGKIAMGDAAREEIRVPVLNNQLVLSVAAQQPGGSALLKDIFRFFMNDIHCVETKGSASFPKEELDEDKILIGKMLSLADFGIQGFDVQKLELRKEDFPDFISEEWKKKFLEQEMEKIFFLHNGVSFLENEESEGTMRFFGLLPWLIGIFSDPDTSDTLFIDEIDCKLHPLLVKMMIRMFQDPELNANHHQLIFTTHNTSLLDSELFRRDQIWFTQKREAGNTELTCLAEYEEVQPDTNFEQWYRMGRFEALPEIAFKEIKAALLRTRELREKKEK